MYGHLYAAFMALLFYINISKEYITKEYLVIIGKYAS